MPSASASPAILERLGALIRRVRIESVSIGPVSLGFGQAPTEHGDAFSSLLVKVASSADRDLDAFVVSAHNMDRVTQVDRIEPDHESAALSSRRDHPGGSGANTAYAMRALGASVAIAGVVGNDADGEALLESLNSCGIETNEVLVEPRESGNTINLVGRDGRRLLVVQPGVNDSFAELVDEQRLQAQARKARILHLSSFVDPRAMEVQIRVAEACHNDTLVSLTPGSLYAEQGLDRLQRLIECVDVLFLYREQLESLVNNSSARARVPSKETPKLLADLLKWKKLHHIDHPLVVVVKEPIDNGQARITTRFIAMGCGTHRLERFIYPGELPQGIAVQGVDTTGAGDAAAAGFLIGLLHGAAMDSALDGAFILATFASTELGARSAFMDPPPPLPTP